MRLDIIKNEIAESIKCIVREKGLNLDTLQEIEILYDSELWIS